MMNELWEMHCAVALYLSLRGALAQSDLGCCLNAAGNLVDSGGEDGTCPQRVDRSGDGLPAAIASFAGYLHDRRSCRHEFSF